MPRVRSYKPTPSLQLLWSLLLRQHPELIKVRGYSQSLSEKRRFVSYGSPHSIAAFFSDPLVYQASPYASLSPIITINISLWCSLESDEGHSLTESLAVFSGVICCRETWLCWGVLLLCPDQLPIWAVSLSVLWFLEGTMVLNSCFLTLPSSQQVVIRPIRTVLMRELYI